MAQEIADSKLIDTWASDGLKVKPDISKIIEGWQLGEQPPHEYMNWLQNTFGSKLNHILKNGVPSWNNTTQYLAGSSVQHSGNVWLCKTTNTNSTPTDANVNWKRIITVESVTTDLGGYVALTGNQTIAGVKTFSSTIAGSINGNSATATKLETARTINGVAFDGTANITVSDSTAVKLTGDQTIAGVKTFSSSPIVPTPTTGTQAVNKTYADLKVALSDFTGTNQNLNSNGYQKLPGGLILQWGRTTYIGQTSEILNFPIAFPNNVFAVSTGEQQIAESAVSRTHYSFTKTAITITRDVDGSAPGSISVNYIAIGN